jgi:hypothetical protein
MLLFIHGGGFTQGSASGDNGTWLATSQRIIVAFVNYRLGPLGFLASDELAAAAGSGGANGGMNGLRDVIAALGWLKENGLRGRRRPHHRHGRELGRDRHVLVGRLTGGDKALRPVSATGIRNGIHILVALHSHSGGRYSPCRYRARP